MNNLKTAGRAAPWQGWCGRVHVIGLSPVNHCRRRWGQWPACWDPSSSEGKSGQCHLGSKTASSSWWPCPSYSFFPPNPSSQPSLAAAYTPLLRKRKVSPLLTFRWCYKFLLGPNLHKEQEPLHPMHSGLHRPSQRLDPVSWQWFRHESKDLELQGALKT